MRVLLVDLPARDGVVSKDTVVGGYGSRFRPFSRVTEVICGFKRRMHDVPSVHLAYLSAAAGWRTLLWDLDPQGGATYSLGVDASLDGAAKRLVRGDQEMHEAIVATAFENLDVLPGDLSLRRMDLHLHERKHPTERLLKMSRALRSRYAALFIDCAQGMSLLSENVLTAADAVVVPLIPAPLSVRMLDQLSGFVVEHGWTDLIVLPFFSMVDRR